MKNPAPAVKTEGHYALLLRSGGGSLPLATTVGGGAPVDFTLHQINGEWVSEAYAKGYATADLLSNPYPDNSVEARRFVDGWVDGRKWDQPKGAL